MTVIFQQVFVAFLAAIGAYGLIGTLAGLFNALSAPGGRPRKTHA